MQKQLGVTKQDSSRFSIYRQIFRELVDSDPSAALKYLPEMRKVAEGDNERLGLMSFLEGWAHETMAEYNVAITKYFEALKHYESKEFNGKTNRIAETYDYIGSSYSSLKNFNQAIKFKLKAIEQYKGNGDKEGEAVARFNLGNTYIRNADYDRGIQAIDSALVVFTEVGDESSLATGNNTNGSIYFMKGDYNKALKYFKSAYHIQSKGNYKSDMIISLTNIGETFQRLSNFDSALYYSEKAKDLAIEGNFRDIQFVVYENISTIYEAQKKYPEAIENLKLSIALKDSVFKTESQKQLQELSVKYDTEKKEAENKILNLQLDRRKTFLYVLGVAAILLFVTAFFIYRAYRNKRQSNKDLAIKNMIIEEKNRLVESKNKDINDSIHYAQRIQRAILPPDKLWFSILPDSFVLYKPKDILSGDFYWIEETSTHILFAAADCTGHGVPGALMSIVNFNLLNKAVLEKNMTDPGRILDAVNGWLTESLHQTYQESAVRDGMDICLCTIEKGSGKLSYAAANNPVYQVKNEKLTILGGDHFPVGAFIDETKRSFTTIEIPSDGSEHIYIFTDGFADQFGGPKGKKFKYKQLQEKIIGMQHLTLQKQKHELSRIFDEWKGDFEQVDDVLIIGVRVF